MSMSRMRHPNGPAIRRALLGWYERHKRDLPWRRTRDPYAIWISEVMLQQTRVAAALPYYERFLKRYPDIESLANAREEELLAAWAGLGYYSRARNLQKAARRIVGAGGGFPRDYESIRELPGVGEYTAAAVASIAYGLSHAAIDGNALRVLSRVTGNAGDIGARKTRKRLEAIANDWLDRARPGDFNQAVMELGAVICAPQSPACAACPLAGYCEAYRTDRVSDYPVKLRSAARSEAAETLFYIERDGKVLLWRRGNASKRLAGFWELPAAGQLNAKLGPSAGEFRHGIVNTTYRFTVLRASVTSAPRGFCWVAKESFGELPLSTTAKKALRCLGGGSA